ncbi:hypothetical protein BaRGS_00011667 [Batillaria attramentaria]|uniref:Uncharacterized protein n=1 Tax=Batillaria attramentaria TaxID=370345 RepID=A0ABD0LCV6_9CAEN
MSSVSLHLQLTPPGRSVTELAASWSRSGSRALLFLARNVLQTEPATAAGEKGHTMQSSSRVMCPENPDNFPTANDNWGYTIYTSVGTGLYVAAKAQWMRVPRIGPALPELQVRISRSMHETKNVLVLRLVAHAYQYLFLAVLLEYSIGYTICKEAEDDTVEPDTKESRKIICYQLLR